MSDTRDGVRAVFPSVSSFSEVVESRTTSVSAGGTDIYALFSPSRRIGKIKTFSCAIFSPPGATSGNHSLIFQQGLIDVLEIHAKFDERIDIEANIVISNTIKTKPLEQVAQVLILTSLFFSETVGLTILYKNNTNAVQTETRFYHFIRQDETVE